MTTSPQTAAALLNAWRTARYPAEPDAPLNAWQAEHAAFIVQNNLCMGCQFYRAPRSFSSQCMALGDPLLHAATRRRWDNSCTQWQARPVFVEAADARRAA